MNGTTSMYRLGDGLSALWRSLGGARHLSRGAAWGMMIVGALLAFEIFNFSTTEFALHDVLGNLTFGGLRWSTVLAIAFCAMDFAGIARIFTPEHGRDESTEVWYLFGAWLLAAGFNATLTWWGVSAAIAQHASSTSNVVAGDTLTRVVPVFVAVMVWLIRVLIIGTFSVAGDRLFSTGSSTSVSRSPRSSSISRPAPAASFLRATAPSGSAGHTMHPAPKPSAATSIGRMEPTYQNLGLEASDAGRDRRLQ